MKFTCTVIINAPIHLVAQIFADPGQQKHFQDGFISKVQLKGNTEEEGSVARLNYKKLELIETIIENKLPGCLCLSSSKMEFLKNTVDDGIKSIISSNGSKIISISITNLVDEVDFTYILSMNKIKLMLDCIKFCISF